METKLTKIKINTELVNKVKDYCSVASIQLCEQTKGTRLSKYLAEEATSDTLLSFHKLNERNNFTQKKQTDNYLFIACKNHVKNILVRENRKKRMMYNDYNNLALDAYTKERDYVLELEDEVYDESYDEWINDKLEFIVDVLKTSKYIRDLDLKIFFWYFVEGKTLSSFSKETGTNIRKCSLSSARIKNVLQHLYQER